MILVKTAADLQQLLVKTRESGLKTGFVPTMGALHEGHLSLIKESKRLAGYTVCSIFVNPTQFNDPADFAKYPVTIENDILLLESLGCDVLFLPNVAEIYPAGLKANRVFDIGRLDTIWEGEHRPGHFQGVCQVMQRLLEIVQPGFLFMGRKDYQQCMVIERLISLNNWPVSMQIVPIMRENSGLAMSSRNTRLSAKGRQQASAVFSTLRYMQAELPVSVTHIILKQAADRLLAAGFDKVDYLALADAKTLEPVTEWNAAVPTVALVAAFLEGVRLIDNMPMTEAE